VIKVAVLLEVNPIAESSVLHAVVRFVTTAAIVLLLHAGILQTLLSQVFMGSMTDAFCETVKNDNKEDGLKQAEVELVAI